MGTADEQHLDGMEAVAEVLGHAVDRGDFSLIGDVLDPAVTWGDCAGREPVLDFLTAAIAVAGAPEEVSFEIAAGRIIAGLTVGRHDTPLTVAIFVRDGKVTELIDAVDRAHALAIRPVGVLSEAAGRGWQPNRLSPILPVTDLSAAISRFEVLGFGVRAYDGDAAYAFATRGSVEFHLTQLHDLDPDTNTSAGYLYVDDADATYAAWRLAGVEGRLTAPTDTEYGRREGAYVDPDGNLLRFGSPATELEVQRIGTPVVRTGP